MKKARVKGGKSVKAHGTNKKKERHAKKPDKKAAEHEGKAEKTEGGKAAGKEGLLAGILAAHSHPILIVIGLAILVALVTGTILIIRGINSVASTGSLASMSLDVSNSQTVVGAGPAPASG